MIYVGIDIAKLNHFSTAISLESEILIEPFKFTYDYDGFYLLLSNLVSLDQNSIIIGLGSTAHYSDNLVRFLINKAKNRSHYNALGHCADKLARVIWELY